MKIAHKQKLKIAVAAWVILCQLLALAVTAFASPPTDGNGNWLPSSYQAYWYIYNLDTQSYDLVDVTSSVDSSGLTFTFPTNLTGVHTVQLFLCSDYYGTSNNYFANTLSFSGYLTYNGSLMEFSSSNFYFLRYFYNGSGYSHTEVTLNKTNPFSYSYFSETLFPFSYFRFYFPLRAAVSGSLTIHFDSFVIGNEDISSKITVQNLDNASDDLGNLAEELAVPTPNMDAIFGGAPSAIAHINDENYQNTYSFFKNDTGIMATYITIVLAMATLGYIFFGKRA